MRLKAIFLRSTIPIARRPSAPFIPWLAALIRYPRCDLLTSDTYLRLKCTFLFYFLLFFQQIYLLQVFNSFYFESLQLFGFSFKRFSWDIMHNHEWFRCDFRFEGTFSHHFLVLSLPHSLEILLFQDSFVSWIQLSWLHIECPRLLFLLNITFPDIDCSLWW